MHNFDFSRDNKLICFNNLYKNSRAKYKIKITSRQ